MADDWKAEPPFVTREQALLIAAAHSAQWRANLSSSRPYLGGQGEFRLADWAKMVAASTDPVTARRRGDLARVADDILHRRWLRVYAHHPERTDAARLLLGFPIPNYRTPPELAIGGVSLIDAEQELWQRDVGDSLPPLALAAYVFPEIAEECRDRMKAIALAALEFPTWGAGANLEFRDMDLAADHVARGLAIAYDWHGDIWSADEAARLRTVVRGKLATLLHGAHGAAFWARGYTDNHCQNAFAALGISGVAFLDEIPEAEEWLGAAVAGFENVARYCHHDGSSSEGVPYWSYGMSFLLQYIELTRQVTGADSLYETGYLRNAASYRLHCSLPDLSGALPIGDAPTQDYYGPSHILYALARRYGDAGAQWLGDGIPFPNRGGADTEVWSLLWRDRDLPASRPKSIPLDFHLPDWDVAVSRSGWNGHDYVLVVKSGFTNRNHSHLDAGALLLGWGGEWLVEAPGYGEVGPGFWDTKHGRWTYYSNSTESHSTLLVDGENQRIDADARGRIDGFRSDADLCWVSADLSGAYRHGGSVRRQVLHRRSQYILVLDEIEAGPRGVVSGEWLLQPGRNAEIQTSGPGLTIRGKAGALQVTPVSASDAFQPREPVAEHIDVAPARIRTQALRSSGESIAFAVLIELIPTGGEPGGVTVSIECWEPRARQVVMRGNGYLDSLGSKDRI